MNWHLKHYNELTSDEIYDILALRTTVFIVEQTCHYQDADYTDKNCWHLWADTINEATGKQEITAYLRILPPHTTYAEASLGRLLVNPTYRRLHLGDELIKRGINFLLHEQKQPCIQIGAQSYLKDFYQKWGFTINSEEYLEDGIPHVDMRLSIK